MSKIEKAHVFPFALFIADAQSFFENQNVSNSVIAHSPRFSRSIFHSPARAFPLTAIFCFSPAEAGEIDSNHFLIHIASLNL